jgi:L-alanine-DL-glutamate epimerase-like enolase superfamily enzyme
VNPVKAQQAGNLRCNLSFDHERWRLREPFHITGTVMTELDVVLVRLEDEAGHVGFGEAAGVDYRADDTLPCMLEQLQRVRPAVEAGLDRMALQSLLPPGGARNALDCALWDLEARRSGRAAWQLAGLPPPRPLLTTYTIGAESPGSMAASAVGFRHARAIKLKLTGEAADAARVSEVRAARPDVWLGVDANQGFSREHFDALLPTLVDARVALIEQPFRVGMEPPLSELQCPIPVAADESVQGIADMRRAQGRFNAVNIKLDKCGGLTEGLAMAREAAAMGFGLMVGNMVGTSLAMAPAFIVGQLCDVVDLDGPVLLLSDRMHRASYRDGCIDCGGGIWGGPR